MDEKVFIGIDPGKKKGAVVAIDSAGKALSKIKLPTRKPPKDSQFTDYSCIAPIDTMELAKFIGQYKNQCAIFCEAMKPFGYKHATESLLRQAGQIANTMCLLKVPFEEVGIKVWQSTMLPKLISSSEFKFSVAAMPFDRMFTETATEDELAAFLIAQYGRIKTKERNMLYGSK